MPKKRKSSILARDGARDRAGRPAKPATAAADPPTPPPVPKKAPAASPHAKRHKPQGPSPFRPSSHVAAVAAAALDRLLTAAQGAARGASLKTLTLGAGTRLPRPQDRRAAYALATRALEAGGGVAGVLAAQGGWPPPARLTRGAALVLGYDLAFGQRFGSVGPAESVMLPFRAALAAAPRPPPPPPPHPRAVRVNTLAWSRQDALTALTGMDVRVDPILADVLLLPPATDLHAHPAVARGALVLQSRASALPAAALAPERGWHVIDACAAPGNKTTQVAAMVGPTGRVTAYDRDPARLALLQASIERAGAATIAQARLGDFLALDPAAPPARDADAVLLDPSCSGSGTAAAAVDAALEAVLAVGAGGGGGDDERPSTRVARLAAFQLAALRHALSFPRVRRVAYSTCSVHVAENEAVVAAALDGDASAPPARAAGWRLATPLPAWPTRGVRGGPLADADADAVVRAGAGDETDGFFVAVFERIES